VSEALHGKETPLRSGKKPELAWKQGTAFPYRLPTEKRLNPTGGEGSLRERGRGILRAGRILRFGYHSRAGTPRKNSIKIPRERRKGVKQKNDKTDQKNAPKICLGPQDCRDN